MGRISSRKNKKEKDPKIGRIWVTATLLITVGLSGLFWIVSALPSIDFSANISTDNKSNNFSGLREKSTEDFLLITDKHLEGKKGSWSIKVTELEGNFSAQVKSEKQMPAASLTKLLVVATLYRQIENSSLSLKDEFKIEKDDIYGGAGSLQYQPIGTKVSLEELAFFCLNQSDNTAFAMLRKILGDDLIQKEINSLGMESTVLVDFVTSAKDIDLFFQKLYRGEVTKTYKDDFIKGLTKTIFETRIPAGVPQGVSVAHKVGTQMGVAADAGIIFVPQKPFILTVLSKDVDSQQADQVVADLTKDIYWFMVSD